MTLLAGAFACSQDTAADIASHAKERNFPPRAIIIEQGAVSAITFLLVEGRVHAVTCSPSGQLVLLQEFLRGDFFGAIVETDAQPAEADVIAADRVRAAAFAILDFLSLLERHSCVGLAVSKRQATRIARRTRYRVRLTPHSSHFQRRSATSRAMTEENESFLYFDKEGIRAYP